MKRLLLALLFVSTAYAQPALQSTAYSRYFLLSTNAMDGVKRLGVQVDNLTQLLALNVAGSSAATTAGPTNVWMAGRSSANDGGQGWFYALREILAADTNLGTIFRSTANTNVIWYRQYSGPLNVQWFGAVGNGSTDNTAAIQSAYDSLTTGLGGPGGGVLYFPIAGGSYKFNLTVLQNNLILQGDASGMGSGGGTVIAPYDNTLPIVTIGNDSGYVKGFQAKDFTALGANSSMGFAFMGGSYQCKLDTIAFSGFTNSIFCSGGTNKECSLIDLKDVFITCPAYGSAVRGVYAEMPTNGTKWCTAITLRGASHVNGNSTSGYAVETAGTSVDLGGTYFDVHDQHGLLLSYVFGASNPNYSVPYYTGDGTTLDSGGATNRSVTIGYTNTWSAASDWFRSYGISLGGYAEMSDGSVHPLPPRAGYYQTQSSYPSFWGNSSWVPSGYDRWSDTNRISVTSAQHMEVRAGQSIRLIPDPLQAAYIFGNPYSYLRLETTTYGKYAELYSNTNGDFNVLPASGGGSTYFRDDAGTQRLALIDGGAINLYPESGVALVYGPSVDFRLQNSTANKKIDMYVDSSGNLELRPTDGTSIELMNSAANVIVATRSAGAVIDIREDPTSTGIPLIFLQATTDRRTYMEFYNGNSFVQRYRFGMDPDNVLNKRIGLYDGSASAMRNWTSTNGIWTSNLGIGSLAVATATPTATGWTNSTESVHILYVTAATGAALLDNAGNTEFSGVTIAAFTPIRIQPSGKFTGTAITYATGAEAHAW